MTDSWVDRQVAASAAAPTLDPASTYGIAQTSTDSGDAITTAQATAGLASAQTAVATLRKIPGQFQRKIWDQLDAPTQQMYVSAGYQPPKKSHGLMSALDDLGGHIGDVAGGALHLGGEALGAVTGAPGISQGLHALGAPLRGVQHGLRAVDLMKEDTIEQVKEHQLPSGLSATGHFLKMLVTPTDWAQAWSDTNDGERTFAPTALARLTRQHGEDTVALARQLAGGTKSEAIIAAAPEQDRAALAQRIQSDPELHQVVTELQNAKLSVGRALVGQHLLNEHPALGHAVAGALDATSDVLMDPVVIGGSVAKSAMVSRYLVSDATRAAEVLDRPGAQRFIQSAADTLSSDGAGGLIRRYPKMAPIAQQLVDEGVDSPEKLTEWFKGQSGLGAIFDGRVGGYAPKGMTGAVVPNLTRPGLLENALKAKGAEAVDFLAEHNVPGAETIRRLTHLVAPGATIDPDAVDGLRDFQRVADYALPAKRADELTSAFAAAKDRAGRYGIYRGMLGEMFDRAGVPEDVRARFFDSLDDAHTLTAYGVGDRMVVDGQTTPVGFLESHVMDQGWSVPDLGMLRAQSDRSWLMQKMYGAVNNDLVDRLMQTVWKPAQLLRLGFPIRTAGEEVVGQALREGPLSVLRGRLAAGAAGDSDSTLLGRIVSRFTSHLPDAVTERVQTPVDLAGAVLGDRTSRFMRNVEGALASDRYEQAAREIAQLVPDALPEEITAAHARGAGFLSDGPSVAKLTRNGVEARPAILAPSGAFRDYTPTESFYTQMWKARLDELGDSRLAKTALEYEGEGRDAQVTAVIDRLGQDDMSYVRSRAYRATALPDGRLVGDGATGDEALRSWAETIVDNTNHLTSDGTGVPLDDIRRAVSSGQPVDITQLNDLPHDLRPGAVTGPDMIPVYGQGKWAEMQQRGFGYIGRSMNWIARQPMFVHNYAEALDDTATLKSALMELGVGEEEAAARVREVAFDRAVNATTPFIHDPKVRSQLSIDMRNLAPFMFAQEQFFKRWARTLAYDPTSFRKAQLGMMGLRHSGIIHTDDQGNDYFMYPGVGAMQQALTKVGSLVLGRDVTLPLPVGFSGQVRFASPGTERIGLPSFGPLVAVPMDAMAKRFPELNELEQSIVGQRGAGRSIWEQVTPSSVARVVHVLIDNPETSPQMHSAMLQSIQYLEATGHGLPDDATAVDKEKYLDRVKSWTRILMLNRAIFGFSVPAAPDLQMDPNHLHDEFRKLLASGVPIDQAVTQFLGAHPDATPYTVFQSKSTSGAPLPATTEAAKFIDDNHDFLASYPEAGAWFLPQKDTSGKFDPAVYREQLALHLRSRKSTEQFYSDMKFAEASGDYFDTRDARDKALAAAKGNSIRTQQINQQWSQFSQQYLTMHPVFAEQLQSPDGEIRRQRALDQLHSAMTNLALPDSPQTGKIRDLVDTYDALQAALAPFAGRRDTAALNVRRNAKAQFISWAHSYTAQHPEIAGLYDRVFRYEVGDNTSG